MPYYHEEKLAFIGHPRTASRATGKALMEAGCSTMDGHHELGRRAKRTCLKIRDSGGIVACTVRNPFDLAVSWYFNWHYNAQGKKRRDEVVPTFDEWVLNGLAANWFLEQVPYYYGLEVSNRVLRYESLSRDLPLLMVSCGLRIVNAKPLGVMDRDRDYRVYYTPDSLSYVEKKFAADFELTGYTY
jgi:hypothetical protein